MAGAARFICRESEGCLDESAVKGQRNLGARGFEYWIFERLPAISVHFASDVK